MATAIIHLMEGVVYRESQEGTWTVLDRHGSAIRDHFATIGVNVIMNETEGFAYLRSEEPEEGTEPLPRLVRRRKLTFNVSLLLVLLREQLASFESKGGEGRLVLTRDQVVEMLRVFLADSTNEARVIDRVDATIGQAGKLGFLRELRGQPGHWEVRRVLRAYVDAETLNDFAARLDQYADPERGGRGDDE